MAMMVAKMTLSKSHNPVHDIYLRKAKLLAEVSGQEAEALVAIERAAALSPGNRDTITLLIEQLSRVGQTARVATYLPPIRSALQANIARGAVSLRDLNLLSKVAAPQNEDLSQMARLLLASLEPGGTGMPKPRVATAGGWRRVLDDPQLRRNLFADGEGPHLHTLLQAVDGVVARLPRDFPGVGGGDSGPLPVDAETSRLVEHARQLLDVLGLRTPRIGASSTHNAVILHQDPICTIRLGTNLWNQGDADSWRGLVAVAAARWALGASRARALSPPNMDLLIAACFEVVDVFNPTTAEPDPHKLRDLVTNLRNVLPRRQKKAVEAACQALASHAFDVGVTARATTATDLRFAALLSGDFGGVLAGACLVDGVVGGTLKQRVGRSKLARDLLTHLLTDEFIAARRASVS